jgi:hypothetical protein
VRENGERSQGGLGSFQVASMSPCKEGKNWNFSKVMENFFSQSHWPEESQISKEWVFLSLPCSVIGSLAWNNLRNMAFV